MSYHCSIYAISAVGKAAKRGYIPVPPKKAIVPWRTSEQMMRYIGFVPGEWILSTNIYGHVQGLKHIHGICIARNGNKRLLWVNNQSEVFICLASNFIPDESEEMDDFSVKAEKPKPSKAKSAIAKFILED